MLRGLKYLERPRLSEPINARHGLYMQVLSPNGSAFGKELLDFVRADVHARGYDPDGDGMLDMPTSRGIVALVYSLWFYDRRKLGELQVRCECHTSHPIDECDAWECKCGNTTMHNGFFPCDARGREVEPDPQKWDGNSMVCGQCGAIISQATGERIGEAMHGIPRRLGD